MGENPDYSAVWAEARSRLAGLLDALGGKLAASDASEIRSYLNAREYGLAVETLASMIADGGKPICETDLREFDGIASLLGLFSFARHTRRAASIVPVRICFRGSCRPAAIHPARK